MKCPKCNYISFDFNRTCPKCGNDNTEEQARLNLSPNKPNPPFFLAALIGVQDSPNYEISANENDIAFPGTPHEEFDAQELLIALDDLQTDESKPDVLEPLDSGENEILFELDPTEDSPTTEKPLDEIEFFSAENTPEDPNDEELLLTLDDFPENESTSDTLASSQPKEEEIAFELDDPFEPVNPPVEKGTLNKFDDIQTDEQDVFLEEVPEPSNEVDLFLEEDVPIIEIREDEAELSSDQNMPEELDAQDLLLTFDDLTEDDVTTDPLTSSQPKEKEIAFELDDPFEPESLPAEKDKDAFEEKGFWNSDEIEKQMAAFGLEETDEKKADIAQKETVDEKKNDDFFLELDLEPLDLELPFEDTEKNPQP